jgi:hypothetical protein
MILTAMSVRIRASDMAMAMPICVLQTARVTKKTFVRIFQPQQQPQ